jgi:electron transfer flavoprotein alpha subunit
MSILVFIENIEGEVKASSLEAVSYAAAMGGDVTALVLGSIESSALDRVGKAGASKILHVADDRLNKGIIQAYTSVIAQAMDKEGSEILVLGKSSVGDPVSARVSIRSGASLATNVIELPDTSNGFKVKTSIYTGKAFANVSLTGDKKILALKKNASKIKEDGAAASIEAYAPELTDADFRVNITKQEKATGDILLPEADIVVSAGRGLKGPENWGMVEELAKELGAATACSKPVSDMDWRPHHEHVGQTGIKVSPTLYIAIGISGAIQHLAGVNSSKVIVVINKDPEAPFFKAGDYGIVGDAFEVVPKLIEAVKAINN